MREPFEAVVGSARVGHPTHDQLDGVSISTVVRPESALQVAACLSDAHSRGLAVVPTGGETKLAWGNRSDAPSLVRLELRGLVGEIALRPEEGTATVAAGTLVEDLYRAAREHGKQTLLDPLYPGATVGGTIAADPIGPEVSADRRLRNDLLGLEVALSNGELTRAGGNVVKNVTGFDLVRLYCGSFGTLGVITRATLRLRPLPEVRRYFSRELESWEAALATASHLLARSVEPHGIGVEPRDRSVRLIWQLEGTEGDVSERAERAVEAEQCAAADWESIRGALCDVTQTPGTVRVRVGARSSDSLTIVLALRELAGEDCLRLVLPAVGLVLADVPETAVPVLFDRGTRQGWMFFMENASQELKSRFDVFGPVPESLPLQRALKKRFDPARVLSPGRFVGRL